MKLLWGYHDLKINSNCALKKSSRNPILVKNYEFEIPTIVQWILGQYYYSYTILLSFQFKNDDHDTSWGVIKNKTIAI